MWSSFLQKFLKNISKRWTFLAFSGLAPLKLKCICAYRVKHISLAELYKYIIRMFRGLIRNRIWIQIQSLCFFSSFRWSDQDEDPFQPGSLTLLYQLSDVGPDTSLQFSKLVIFPASCAFSEAFLRILGIFSWIREHTNRSW